MLGRVNGEKIKKAFCFYIIVLNECLHAIFVLLAAHMLVGREICDNVKSLLLTENTLKDRIGKTQRISSIFFRDIHSFSAAEIAGKFCQSILIQIYHHQFGWLEREHRFYKR